MRAVLPLSTASASKHLSILQECLVPIPKRSNFLDSVVYDVKTLMKGMVGWSIELCAMAVGGPKVHVN